MIAIDSYLCTLLQTTMSLLTAAKVKSPRHASALTLCSNYTSSTQERQHMRMVYVQMWVVKVVGAESHLRANKPDSELGTRVHLQVVKSFTTVRRPECDNVDRDISVVYLPCFADADGRECLFASSLHSERHFVSDITKCPKWLEQRLHSMLLERISYADMHCICTDGGRPCVHGVASNRCNCHADCKVVL